MSDHLPDVKLPMSLPAAVYDGDLWVKASDVQLVLAELRTVKEDLQRTESARVAILAENTHYKRQLDEANDTIINRVLPPLAVTQICPACGHQSQAQTAETTGDGPK